METRLVDLSVRQDDDRDAESPPNADPTDEWPVPSPRPSDLFTPIEAAQYLRLDESGLHTPRSAIRTLNFWRDKGELKATKFARRIWYRRTELDRFLERKTEK